MNVSAKDFRWHYRPALTGIRVPAVYLVVFYHCGLSIFSSGYIGVDFFFVLSGYLICNLLVEEYERNGRINLARFYVRRIRRLLPALSAMVIFVSSFFVLIQSQTDRMRFVPHATASLFYFANWNLIAQAADYFAPEAQENPFVHLWSLSIEEQYYLLFPILLIFAYWVRKKLGDAALMVVLLSAFFVGLLVQLGLSDDALRSYYGTDTRVYQLLAGAALAVGLRHRMRRVQERNFVRMTRTATLAGAFLALSTSLSSQLKISHVGILATFVGLLLIWSVENDNPGPVTRILSCGPCVYLGNISYATYLWHWPIVVLIRILFDMNATVLTICVTIASTIFASASFHMLETPLRNHKFTKRDSAKAFAISVSFTVFVASTGVPQILKSDVIPSLRVRTVPIQSVNLFAQTNDVAPYRSNLLDEPKTLLTRTNCIGVRVSECYLHRGAGATILLIGDSHAEHLATMFIDVAKRLDASLVLSAVGSCPWPVSLTLPNIRDDNKKALCENLRRDNLLRVIPQVAPELIVVTNRTFDSPYRLKSFNELGIQNLQQIVRESTGLFTAGGRRLLIIEPVPETNGFNPRACVLDALQSDESQSCEFLASQQATDFENIVREVDVRNPHILTIDIDNWVCPRMPICDPIWSHTVVWSDNHHVSPGLTRLLGPRMAEIIRASQFLEPHDRRG